MKIICRNVYAGQVMWFDMSDHLPTTLSEYFENLSEACVDILYKSGVEICPRSKGEWEA